MVSTKDGISSRRRASPEPHKKCILLVWGFSALHSQFAWGLLKKFAQWLQLAVVSGGVDKRPMDGQNGIWVQQEIW